MLRNSEDSDQGKRHYLPQIHSKTGHTNKIFKLALLEEPLYMFGRLWRKTQALCTHQINRGLKNPGL